MKDNETKNETMRAALLVIDVQIGLFEQSRGIYLADQLLENLDHLIHKARRTGTPVFFIQHENERFLKRDTAPWQLHPRLQPLESEKIIHKKHGNAFEKTMLKDELARKSVNKLVITGLVSHGCVRATCLGAIERGYRVVLVSDGHSSYSKDAEKLVDKWNSTLMEKGAELRKARAVEF